MIRAIILLLFITQSALAAEISIKFHEDAGVKLAGNRFVIDSLNARAASSSSSQSDVDAINNTLQRLQRNSARENSTTRTQALVVAPFGGYSARFLSEWRRTAEEFWGEPLEDLSQFYSISVDENDHSAIESFFALKSLGVVEEIEFISVPVLTSASATPSFESKQGYLENNDNGIYAHHAWTLDGGRGNGTKVVAIEGAWNADHEDFPDLFYSSVIGASGESSVQHGTQSMGVVGAKDNGFGMTGIVSSASFGVETYGNLNYNGPNSNNLPSDYITNAAIAVGVGGVVFIEFGRLNPVADIYTPDCTCGLSQCGQMAIEISSPAFNAIKQAVGNGVIVVEPAGNGTADMDHSVYEGKFDRNIRDSGAIMVGASIPTDRTPLCFTNYGSRIDVHAWGAGVATLGYIEGAPLLDGPGGNLQDEPGSNKDYTYGFNGTSSATAIVAGAAASVQGILKAHGKPLLNSLQMREILRSSGTAQTNEFSKNIGSMPNIIRTIESLGITNPNPIPAPAPVANPNTAIIVPPINHMYLSK